METKESIVAYCVHLLSNLTISAKEWQLNLYVKQFAFLQIDFPITVDAKVMIIRYVKHN